MITLLCIYKIERKKLKKKKKKSALKEAVQYLILSQLAKNLKIPYWLLYQSTDLHN